MLVIRDAQIQKLINAANTDVTDAVEMSIRRAAPDRVKGIAAKQVSAMADICVKRANAAGIERTEDIGAFAALMLVVSPRFDEEPAMADVLSDTRFSAGERLFQLFERVADENWDAAVGLYDAQFWFNSGNSTEVSGGIANSSENKPAVDYVKLAAAQADAVEAALKNAKESPGERASKQVEVEVEKLCFCLTAADGDHKKRALRAAESARAAILGKVIAKPPRVVQ